MTSAAPRHQEQRDSSPPPSAGPARLAIVVPCYNERDVLPETASRLTEILERLRHANRIGDDSRIYFVDDGSSDDTWSIIAGFVRNGLPVVGIKLSRNRGHQNALLAGLFLAEGDVLITIDADLQDEVGAIDQMLDHYRRGCDIVYGVRASRDSDSVFKRLSAESFYRLLTASGVQTVFNHADYRLMSRRAVEALRGFREVNLYLRGIVPLIGFPSTTVEYRRTKRLAGKSKYSIGRMMTLALEAITSFSIVPLRLISLMGFAVFAGSMAVSAWALWAALVSEETIPGWASTVLPMYFLGGVQLLALGVIGEYLGKLYVEAKSRPRFFVDQVIGDAGGASPALPAAEMPTSKGDAR